jgi:hypothetical protein
VGPLLTQGNVPPARRPWSHGNVSFNTSIPLSFRHCYCTISTQDPCLVDTGRNKDKQSIISLIHLSNVRQFYSLRGECWCSMGCCQNLCFNTLTSRFGNWLRFSPRTNAERQWIKKGFIIHNLYTYCHF